MNPIASAQEKAQEPALVRPERSRLGERSSLMRVAPGRLSGTAAKLRRLLFRPLLRLATAPHIVSSRFGFYRSSSRSELVEEMPVAATERGSQFEVGRQLAWERLSQPQNPAAFGIGLGTEARSRRSSFLLLSRPAIARYIAS
jgi:hypothetical protein